MGTWERKDKSAEPPYDLILEQTIVRLCELYRCTPSQIDGEEWERCLLHLEIKAIESEVGKSKYG